MIDNDPVEVMMNIDPYVRSRNQKLITEMRKIITPGLLKKYIDAKIISSNKKDDQVPDLSVFGDKDRLYELAYKLEMSGDIRQAIYAYAAAAKEGSRKASVTLANMAMENSLYFIEIEDMTGGEQ